MKTRYDERLEGDNTPSRDVARKYRESLGDDDDQVSLALISYRGGEDEFLLGKEYCESDDAGDRATGADILAQLGWGDQTFQNESIEILTGLLGDSDPRVVYCAAIGLGHRFASTAIPALIQHVSHPDPLVRYGVAFGLLRHEDPAAIEAMVQLATDEDRDVRNWAVFGLGTLIECDLPEIRDVLRLALDDDDFEIRGEALVGLAKRGNPAIVSDLLHEWKDGDVACLVWKRRRRLRIRDCIRD